MKERLGNGHKHTNPLFTLLGDNKGVTPRENMHIKTIQRGKQFTDKLATV